MWNQKLTIPPPSMEALGSWTFLEGEPYKLDDDSETWNQYQQDKLVTVEQKLHQPMFVIDNKLRPPIPVNCGNSQTSR